MQPPFTNGVDPQPAKVYQVSIWWENPELAEQVDSDSGIATDYQCLPSYVAITWEGGTTQVIPRERVVNFLAGAVAN